MVAEFYLIAESFEQNSDSTIQEIELKTKSLAIDFAQIRKYKETNKLLVHPEIYNITFLNQFTLTDLLFNNEIANSQLDRDVRNALKRIVLESEETSHTSTEVKEVLLNEHNEDLCHGLIAFNPVHDINLELQIVYNFRGWQDFRRYYLSLYPKNPTFFIDECKKYFPMLFFHERNKETISSILNGNQKKIVFHLSALNDNFRDCQQANLNRTQVLNHFSARSNLDETASLEGNASRKADFTFIFLNNQNQPESVCCEPHLKLCRNDNYPGDNSYSTERRIYFHEGRHHIKGGRILIGHIGNHL